jgi:integrase
MSRGQGRVYQRGSVWWLDYSLGSRRHREPTTVTTKRDAQDILRKRIGDRQTGTLIGRPDRILLAQYEEQRAEDGTVTKKLLGGLRWLHETQYDIDGLRSKERMVDAWNHIETFFPAPTRVLAITPTRLDEYAKARLAEGAARQTVNNELATLRRGFRLAIEKGLLSVMPLIKLAKVQNARKGFFEDGDFAVALLGLLDTDEQEVVRFLRLTGWRVEEPLGLTWDQVDREGEVLRLYAHETKGKAGRVFPFALAPELKALLDGRWEKRNGPFVFHKDGNRIAYTTLHKHWKKACKSAGLAGRLIHDLRRTAARDMRRAGLSEGEIMKLCGWKTRAMFDRYNIIDEADLAAAVAKRFNGTVVAQSTLSPEPAAR